MIPFVNAPQSFVATRWMSRHGLSRVRFEAAQARALNRWLARDLPKVAAYAQAPTRLQDVPVIDKARMMGDFAAYNIARLSADDLRQAIGRDSRIDGFTVGASTGTSGNRGLFVISDAERFRWLGAILAKTMADLLWQPQRIAVLLPQGTALYDAANRVQRLKLRFFDLHDGPEVWQPGLETFDPTVIVAPPRVLRFLAQTDTRLAPRRVFSAAETLDPVDRPIIETRFGAPLEQIYMATEGLLATTCRWGKLHLAEDAVFFEFEPVRDGLVSPLITSFRRSVQIMARYRMNDLLRLDPTPCPCGSPLQAVRDVVGRMDDCFRLSAGAGAAIITPDVLRNAVLDADPRIEDFRLIQTARDQIELVLPPGLADPVANAAKAGVDAVLKRRGVTARLTTRTDPLPLDVTRKLRRVECRLPNP
ncbi:MAG: CoF synthetase [Pseudomonadota bacterium]